mgnify:CR=1 FL=1
MSAVVRASAVRYDATTRLRLDGTHEQRWKGFLKISLVNIPIKVFPATESSGDDLVQPASRRVPDAHPAEALVPALQPRGAELGDRQGLRVREGALRRHVRGRLRQGPARVDARHRPGRSSPTTSAIDPIYVDRAYYLAPDGSHGGRRVRRDARGDEGQGRHRQARLVRPRVLGRRPAAAARHRDVHRCITRRRSAASTQSTSWNAVPATVKPEEMKLARQVIGTFEGPLEPDGLQGRVPRRAAARSSTRRSPARRSSRRRSDAPPKVVNLMDALKKSLDAVSTVKRKPAKAEVRQACAAAKRKRA